MIQAIFCSAWFKFDKTEIVSHYWYAKYTEYRYIHYHFLTTWLLLPQMLLSWMHKQQRRQQTKQRQFSLTGIITPVSVNELMHSGWICLEWGRCCACYLHLISRCVIFYLIFNIFFSRANIWQFLCTYKRFYFKTKIWERSADTEHDCNFNTFSLCHLFNVSNRRIFKTIS